MRPLHVCGVDHIRFTRDCKCATLAAAIAAALLPTALAAVSLATAALAAATSAPLAAALAATRWPWRVGLRRGGLR